MSEQEIRNRITSRNAAINAHDVEGVVACVAEDVTLYELVPPLETSGLDAARQRTLDWFDTYQVGPTWEDASVTVLLSGDLAMSHSLSHVTGTAKSGDEVDMWFRTTFGWQRTDAGWQISHEHISFPSTRKLGRGISTSSPKS